MDWLVVLFALVVIVLSGLLGIALCGSLQARGILPAPKGQRSRSDIDFISWDLAGTARLQWHSLDRSPRDDAPAQTKI